MKNLKTTLAVIPLLFLFLLGTAEAAPTTSKISTVSVTPTTAKAGKTFKFTATLTSLLTTGNKVKIDLGTGLVATTGSARIYSLSRAIYTVGKQNYTFGIYDAKNVLQGLTKGGSYTVTPADPTTPTVDNFVLPTTGFTKVCNNGFYAGQGTCPKDPYLGKNANEWACTHDNIAKILWEVKSTDKGLRDLNWSYSWYEPNASLNYGYEGTQNGGICKDGKCDTHSYPIAVNATGLCGAKDWRVPTSLELKNAYQTKGYLDYFPDISTGEMYATSDTDFSIYYDQCGKNDLICYAGTKQGDKFIYIDEKGFSNSTAKMYFHTDGTQAANGTNANLRLVRNDLGSAPKIVLPAIKSFAPNKVVSGQTATFTFTGANLVKGMVFTLDSCVGIFELAGGTDTQRQFSCTPTAIGEKSGSLKLSENGTASFKVTVSEPLKEPKITSYVPDKATLNELTTFTFSGTDFVAGMQFSLDGCNGITELANGTATQRQFSCTPTSAGAKTGILKTSATNSSTFAVTVAEPAPVSTTGYTKIANDGSALPDSATLGANPKDWACTKDNKTGLIWEVKTSDGGLHDKDWIYTWYEPDTSKNGGFEGYTDIDSYYVAPKCSTKDNCNTYAFTNAVNNQSLCGKNDWRLPTRYELIGLVLCSDGKYSKDIAEDGGAICKSNENLTLNTTSPTIDTAYFPNTSVDNSMLWSSSRCILSNPMLKDREEFCAGGVFFNIGYASGGYKYDTHYVQLVRNVQ